MATTGQRSEDTGQEAVAMHPYRRVQGAGPTATMLVLEHHGPRLGVWAILVGASLSPLGDPLWQWLGLWGCAALTAALVGILLVLRVRVARIPVPEGEVPWWQYRVVLSWRDPRPARLVLAPLLNAIPNAILFRYTHRPWFSAIVSNVAITLPLLMASGVRVRLCRSTDRSTDHTEDSAGH